MFKQNKYTRLINEESDSDDSRREKSKGESSKKETPKQSTSNTTNSKTYERNVGHSTFYVQWDKDKKSKGK
jgi:hypothetical protein